MEKGSALQQLDTVEILQTIGNSVRKSVLTALASRHTALKFSELMEASGLDPNFDTGQFWYHLSELMSKGIIIKNEDRYGLSQFGYKLAKILDTVERECSFLLKEMKEEGDRETEGRFRIGKYVDADFDEVAGLVREMYNYYWAELLHGGEMSPEYARHTVATDLLVPGTYVYVAEDLEKKKLVGFVSYYVTHGGAFFLDYLWVEKEYLATKLREAFLERVQEDVLEAGEDQYHVRVGVRDRLYGEFFVHHGFDTLNQLEITKYLKGVPKRKHTAENVEIFGFKFKRVI
jgi:DNA-binding HxlR family transcriptional regulator